MNETTNVKKIETGKEAREHLRLQLSEYVEKQPESTQSFHRWMKLLEAAGAGIIAAAFITALYFSFAWKRIDPILIPTAWFAFVVSASPLAVLIGLHSLILKAFPPVILPGKVQKFVTGSGAMWPGWGFILMGLAVAAFWGLFAYATWTLNWAMLKTLISILGVGMTISILYAIFQKILKSR